VPGATLRSQTLSLLTFKTRSRLRYLRFLLAVIAGRQTFSEEVQRIDATNVDCQMKDGSKATIYVEADGEVLGHLPARLEVAPQQLTLLIPPGAQP
jgi:diacylglycerol kinase family enzyme